MELPKFLIADNSKLVSNDEVHWMEEFDKEDEASLKSESQSLIEAAFEFYDNEMESLE